jgi:hypothetical protein
MKRLTAIFLLVAALLIASCGLKINMPTLSNGGSGASIAALEIGR